MDLPERGGGSVDQTSLSALIGQGLHGFAPSGRGLGLVGGNPLHVCLHSSSKSYNVEKVVCGSGKERLQDLASASQGASRQQVGSGS